MRKGIFSIALLTVIISACTTTVITSKPLPPGQAKKVSGTNSAKSYAPGQQKKKH